MRRRIRLALSILSAVLFAAVVVAWARSHTLGESAGAEYFDAAGKVTRIEGIFSAGGQFAVGSLQVEHPTLSRRSWVQMPAVRQEWNWRRDHVPVPVLTDTAHNWLSRLGVGRRGARTGSITRHVFTGLGLPYWLLALLTAALPAWIILTATARTFRRLERARLGLCLHCGYDLRGSRERCPECGKLVSDAS